MGKHILVTGAIRSGSTWTGNVIAQSKKVRYIGEPFNFTIKRFEPIFKNWYECLIGRSETELNEAKAYLASFYSITDRRMFKNELELNAYNYSVRLFKELRSRLIRRTLFKDPLAFFSAEWIYSEFNLDVVMVIRHPAAFVASIKMKNWPFNFDNFLNQENLMSSYLQDYESEINALKNKPTDIIDNAILHWNCIYDTVIKYQNKYGDSWYFVKHEDLSRNPEDRFKKIFIFLNLKYDKSVREYIFNSTKSSIVKELERDSLKNIHTWKNRLTREEIQRVKEGTKKVWSNFYTEADW